MRNKSFIIRYDLFWLIDFRYNIINKVEDLINNINDRLFNDINNDVIKEINDNATIKIHDIDFIINDTFNINEIIIVINWKQDIISNFVCDLIDDSTNNINDVENKFFETILTRDNSFDDSFINDIEEEVDDALYAFFNRYCKNINLIEKVNHKTFKTLLTRDSNFFCIIFKVKSIVKVIDLEEVITSNLIYNLVDDLTNDKNDIKISFLRLLWFEIITFLMLSLK